MTKTDGLGQDDGHLPELVSLAEWERRKAFVHFSRADEDVLEELHLVARAYADEVLERLYERWLQVPELRAFFGDAAVLNRVKALQRRYFISLTQGRYGKDYLEDRLRIGRVHRRIGLKPQWYMGAYAIYFEIVMPRVFNAFQYDRSRQERAVGALAKLVSLDQELALLSYFAEEARRR